MKKIIIFLAILACSGCKDFLEKVPTDFTSPESYFNTEKDLETALVGVYDILGHEYVYGKWYQFQISVGTDESYMTGVQPAGSLNTYQHEPSNIYLTNLWRYIYSGIERANQLIAHIDKPKMDEGKRKQILGEVLFLRSYFYFILVTHFGDVPLKLDPTSSINNTDIKRSDMRIVYEQILTDMKRAETYLEGQTAAKVGFGGRVSLSAVRGILARVYLHMAGFPLRDTDKYKEVIAYTQKVINSGEHELNPSFEQIFINYAQDKYDVKESIWEVEFWGNRTGNAFMETGQIGTISGPFANDVTIGKSTGSVKTTGLLFKAYEEETGSAGTLKYSPDLRRDWTCVQYTFGTAVSNPDWNKTASVGIYNMDLGKWRREFETLTPKHSTFTPQNFPLLRYSDILLMYAEAENEINGVTEEAKAAINLVRKRAYGKLLNGSVLKRIAVTNGGSGYVTATPPKVIISGGGGANAEAIAIVASGRVTEVIITRAGKGFTAVPTISFAAASGSGAVAQATLVNPALVNADLSAQHTASKDAFRSAIQKERMREFAGENLRRQDLIRWGKLMEFLQVAAKDIVDFAPANRKYTAQAGDNVADRDVLLPIPAYEMNLNKLLTQNPGW